MRSRSPRSRTRTCRSSRGTSAPRAPSIARFPRSSPDSASRRPLASPGAATTGAVSNGRCQSCCDVRCGGDCSVTAGIAVVSPRSARERAAAFGEPILRLLFEQRHDVAARSGGQSPAQLIHRRRTLGDLLHQHRRRWSPPGRAAARRASDSRRRPARRDRCVRRSRDRRLPAPATCTPACRSRRQWR